MSTPAERARQDIDMLLTTAGWCVQSRDALDLSASLGVAVRFAMAQVFGKDWRGVLEELNGVLAA